MDGIIVGFIAIAVLFLFLVIGVPVGISLLAVGLFGYAYLSGFSSAIGMAGTVVYASAASYSLTLIPLFIIMGYLAFYAGMTHGFFDSAYRWVGRLPGGLGITTALSAGLFAAVCGSSTATAATVGKIALPEMERYKYDGRLSTGAVAACGTLGVMIPPSALMVIYGMITETSIAKLLIAGILPGILTIGLYSTMIITWAKKSPGIAPKPEHRFTWGEKFIGLKGIAPMALIFGMLIGGIYSGTMTATEAGSMSAFIAFVIFFISKGRSFKNLKDSALETGAATCMILLIIIGANTFGKFLAYSGFAKDLVAMAGGLSPVLLILAVIVIHIFLGMFMDGLAMILVTLPIIFPLMMSMHLNPIWLGIIMVKLVEVAAMTPPVGMNVFVVKGIAPNVPLESIFAGAARFLAMDMIFFVLLWFIPGIALFLPNLMQ